MGFGDFLSGIWDSVTGAITNSIPTDLSQLTTQEMGQLTGTMKSQYGTNYIAAQNAAEGEIARALSNFNASKPHTGADYASFELEISGISNTFTAYAQTLNNSRAMKGASDISNLARQVNMDRETERNALGIPVVTSGVTTKGTWQAGNPVVSGAGLSGLTSSPYFLPGLVIVGYLFLRRR
jgi:hypothetical protein